MAQDMVSERKIVGYFSVDEDGNYLPNSSKLRYFTSPITDNVYFDLNKGIESAITRSCGDEDNSGISHLLEWIKLNHQNIQGSGSKSWIEPKFVCSSGLLVSLMCNPYTKNYNIRVCAAKWKGTIYMCRFDPQQKYQTTETALWDKYMSWGCKFKQYILSDHPDEDPDPSKAVIKAAHFRCIIQRKLGNHSIVFSAVMDGVDSNMKLTDPLPLNDLRFVQLKLKSKIDPILTDIILRKYKYLLWWAQSFLVGNENVFCGFRDKDGIVNECKSYSLSEMVNLSRGHWDPSSCVTNCQEFLDHVAQTVVDDCDKTIYKFEKKFQNNSSRIITEELSPQSEYAFMPMSYLAATGSIP